MLPLKEIDMQIPKKGTIIDLGCGEGVIAKFLSQDANRNVIGVDLDIRRIEKSTRRNLSFKNADIRTYKFKEVDGVVVSDVLHHLNFPDQEKVLLNISKSLKKGGTLVIKEIDTQEFIRSKLSRFWDFIFYPKEKIYFSNAKELQRKLKRFGFKVSTKRKSKFFPGSTMLFVCKR